MNGPTQAELDKLSPREIAELPRQGGSRRRRGRSGRVPGRTGVPDFARGMADAQKIADSNARSTALDAERAAHLKQAEAERDDAQRRYDEAVAAAKGDG